ncbi:MAG: peptide/nickel transport system permease protein [Verrucomicrobia bacterium]|nr:MAG: peptide/nickel transport system permease protein [Verrucomicrobiota bacterium]
MKLLDQIWVQNLCLIAGYGSLAFLVGWGMRSERWLSAWKHLRRDVTGMISLGVVLLYLLVGTLESIAVPSLSGGRSLLQELTSSIPQEKSYSAPLSKAALSLSDPIPLLGRHLLGTDALGRDTLVQTLRATRSALWIGGLTSLIYIPLGVLLGMMAGYYKGWVDDVVQYVYSTVAAVPEILMLVAILMVLGKGLGSMAIALGITGWVGMARLIRGETLRQVERPYIAAAKAMGQSNWKIITRHLLPNVMHLVLIKFVLGFSGLVLAEAVLSYLGVGAPVGTASWGTMIDASRSELSREPFVWWNLTAASTALFIMVLALNLFGDSLRRAFDPKQGL